MGWGLRLFLPLAASQVGLQPVHAYVVVHFVGDVVHIKGYVRRVDSVSLTVGLPSDTTGTLTVTWGVYGDTTVRAHRIVRATLVMGGSASCLASHYCHTPIVLALAKSSSPRHFLVSQP